MHMETDTTGLQLPRWACTTLFDELPRAADFAAALQMIENMRQRMLGDGLLTVNLNMGSADADRSTGRELLLRRLWSSNATAYPVSGYKRKSLTPWTQQLLVESKVFIAEGDADLRDIFDDYERIASLNLHCSINVPLLDAAGNCFATFNALGNRTVWSPEEIWLIRLLAVLATPFVQQAAGAPLPLRA